jgi:glycosyltransferase involved in cell wall biosynthesis
LQTIAIAFLIAGSIQIIFFALFIAAFSGAKGIESTEAVEPVSILICTHDEEVNIRELLPQLLAQDYPDFEIIVVDDRSNDNTYDYLLEATERHRQLRMVTVEQKPDHISGKKFALTLGIRAASNDWLLLTDADCRPKNNRWLRSMTSCFTTKTQLVLGYSPYLRSGGLLNSFIRFEGLTTAIQYLGMALLGKPYMGVGRNIAYRKSLFLNHKGFNGHLGITGGDDDLFVNTHAQKSNTVVCIGEDALVYSHPKLSWMEFHYQKLRHLSVGRFYKFSDRLVLGLFTLSWLLVWALAVPSAFVTSFTNATLLLFIARWIFLILLFHFASRRLGDPFESWKVPFLDFIYAIYYLVTGLAALQSKRIRWKKS